MYESSFTEPGEAVLFATLGNPGERYKNTRHNIGFIFADHLVTSLKLNDYHYCEKMRAYVSVTEKFETNVVILKPNTYMNLSGKAVAPAVDAFSVEMDNVFIVHDDIHIDFGTHRLKRGGGGNGGHNGIISIEEELGNNKFNRIKLGIGKPEDREMLKDYVLTNFLDDELAFVDNSWALSWEQIFDTVLKNGLTHAMNTFNRRVK